MTTNSRVAVAQAAQDAICQVVGDLSASNEIFKNVISFLSQGPLNSPFNPGLYPIFLCDDPPLPPRLPPFTGGQCNTSYQVNYFYELRNYDDPSFVQPTNGFVNLPGAILGAVELPSTLPKQAWGIQFQQPGQPVSVSGGASTGGRFYIDPFSITSVTRLDGLPDNCGDPPLPPIPPPAPNSNVTNTTITYNNSQGGTTNIDATLTVGIAFVNASAEVVIPVTVNFAPNASLTVNVNASTGGVTINPGPETGLPRYPDDDCNGTGYQDDDPESPLPPSDSDPSDPDDNPDNEEVIVAVVVTVTEIESRKPTQILQTGNPDVYAPYLGLVNFLIKAGVNEGAAWSQDLYVKNRRQFIPCPWEGGAIAVDGTPIPGVEWVLTPIRRKIKTPQPF